jgi:hypothetical protein
MALFRSPPTTSLCLMEDISTKPFSTATPDTAIKPTAAEIEN